MGYAKKLRYFKILWKKCLTVGRVLGITTNALRHSGSEKALRGREERGAEEPFWKNFEKSCWQKEANDA